MGDNRKGCIMADYLTPHFGWDEVRCRCCGSLGSMEVQANARRLAQMLEKVRAIFGGPMPVVSWYRCEEHNDDVGGVPGSYHLLGLAADVRVRSSQDRYRLVQAAMEVGVERIGVYASFVHLDLGADPSPVLWIGR